MNYTKSIAGKTLDIDWFNITESTLEGEINFRFGDRSRRITGLDKMIQKWLLLFMTPVGSDVFEPNHGTELSSLMEASGNNKQYITSVVNASISDASEQLLEIQQAEPPTDPDEWFSSASLLKLEFTVTSVTVYIRIVNRQGLNRTLTLPTPMTVG